MQPNIDSSYRYLLLGLYKQLKLLFIFIAGLDAICAGSDFPISFDSTPGYCYWFSGTNPTLNPYAADIACKVHNSRLLYLDTEQEFNDILEYAIR